LRPWGIMGTQAELKAVAPASQQDAADKALADAEAALRRVEMLMSRRIDTSELSRFNASEAGQFVPLSEETLEVLRASRKAWQESRGAFDVTCLPIMAAWEEAGKAGKAPDAARLAAARRQSSWDDIEVQDRGAVKKKDSARVDLGGIAKGFGIDKAVEAMMKTGVCGGQVDVGGDIRCFGRPAMGQYWPVDVRSPFGEGAWATLNLGDAAVCTSGHRERRSRINGEWYSHIVDPRSGARAYMALPANSAPPSVTVVAPTATVADAWATALSVLGPEGLKLLPKNSRIEAMVVTGTPGECKLYMTTGFDKLLAEKPKAGQIIVADDGRPQGR